MNLTKKISCKEVLRAFAVILVVLHHINGNLFSVNQYKLYKYFNGSVGVDLFFVISGFVIARNLYPLFNSNLSFKKIAFEFWLKRAFRLLPSAWLWLLVAVFLAAFFNDSTVFGSVETNIKAALAGFLNVANVRFVDAFGSYFYGTSFVYWSLSLEEQFYFILPFLMFLFKRKLVYFLLFVFFAQVPFEKGLWGVMFRTEAIVAGVLLALWEGKKSYHMLDPRWLKNKFLSMILLFILMASMWMCPILVAKGYNFYVIVALIAVLLVWVASYNQGYFFNAVLVGPVFQYIGSRSYAIYLVHIPVFFILREVLFRLHLSPPDYIKFFIAITAVLILAELNYRIIENPLRILGAKYSREWA